MLEKIKILFERINDIDDKIRDSVDRFAKKHKWKILLISFLVSLAIFLISVFTLNEIGLSIILIYPFSAILFLLDVFDIVGHIKGSKYSGSIFMMTTAIIGFITGFFT